MNKLCTICARSGSKEVPKKNIKILCGKPLIGYTIEQAIDSNLFTSIAVSTDSNEIAKIAEQFGIKVWFLRPKELSGDSTPKIDVIKNALFMAEKKFELKYDIIIDLDVTSPLRLVEDIKESFAYFINGNFDNLITGSISRRNPYFNMVEISGGRVKLVKSPGDDLSRRQDAPPVFDINASVYIWTRDTLLTSESLYNETTVLYIMPEERSIDIDTIMDWQLVEFLMRKSN